MAKTTNSEDVSFRLEDINSAFYISSLGPKGKRGDVIRRVTDYVTNGKHVNGDLAMQQELHTVQNLFFIGLRIVFFELKIVRAKGAARKQVERS